jgi:hypothetical protein
MKNAIFAIRRTVSGPALATSLLALYGVALVTHTVAGIATV